MFFDDCYTVSAVFYGARGYQHGAKMEAKMEQNGAKWTPSWLQRLILEGWKISANKNKKKRLTGQTGTCETRTCGPLKNLETGNQDPGFQDTGSRILDPGRPVDL